MARTLSLDLLNAMYAEESDEVIICLLSVTHPSWGTNNYYISSNATDRLSDNPLVYKTTSNGRDYIWAPFQIHLPDDVDEQAPSVQFMVENIDRSIIARIRNLNIRQGRAKLGIQLVKASAPNYVEIDYPDFDIVNASFNMNVVTFTAQIDALTKEPYPAQSFDPSGFPAIHGTPDQYQ